MELSAGMYVRTDNGDITKICSIWENERVFFENKVDIGYLSSDSFGIGFLNKCKASHNIIDLIEVGDYVNGYKVLTVNIDKEKNNWIIILNSEIPKYLIAYDINSVGPIKSIVTKEMFANAKYKIGD